MTDTASGLVTTMPIPGITLLTLNRPRVANSFDTALAVALTRAFDTLAEHAPGCRGVVVTGSGERAFCAGADLKEREGMTDDAWSAQHAEIERMIRAILACPLPVIAAVNGAAIGGGCEIALACDFIYASESATFALTEVTRGIMPGAGGTQTLPRAIGTRAALELLLTGRPLRANEALRLGLVNRVCAGPVLEEALACAARISESAPLAVREVKAAVRAGLDLPLGEALERELVGYRRLVPTQDRREGVRAFNERRPPRFTGQ
ncbi:MAG: enoyl-CoA hydratase/isomerase family protein [Proteobacteria bacterium]|nr:enoyl-CoA hydratase/isomerase family protein [Pseudomonadota bacterium]